MMDSGISWEDRLSVPPVWPFCLAWWAGQGWGRFPVASGHKLRQVQQVEAKSIPVKTRRWSDIGLMLVQRRRRTNTGSRFMVAGTWLPKHIKCVVYIQLTRHSYLDRSNWHWQWFRQLRYVMWSFTGSLITIDLVVLVLSKMGRKS